jgi:ABC-type transport system involved in cytochrome bd biosynthesis fused ATPase/permease subunit
LQVREFSRNLPQHDKEIEPAKSNLLGVSKYISQFLPLPMMMMMMLMMMVMVMVMVMVVMLMLMLMLMLLMMMMNYI